MTIVRPPNPFFNNDESEGEDSEEESGRKRRRGRVTHPDLKMFAGMFRTAMDMLEESGELCEPPKKVKTVSFEK